MKTTVIRGMTVPVTDCHAAVVGSGAAGLNCAALLARGGMDTLLLTEGMNMGTSRNTGSDKQTYYKLTLTGAQPDSVRDMAQTYYDGASMHGDFALIEAASSARAFFRLVELGVPFPTNEYGEYVGYKTDHDSHSRATSCGPLTSRLMTEALERDAVRAGVRFYDACRVIEICTENRQFCGFLALDAQAVSPENPLGLHYFRALYAVWATGGPSAIYASSVYPESQTCAHGTAFRAGVRGANLTESQYGIASVAFRWNLSGSYQQVVPYYYSTACDGVSDARPLLNGCFNEIFLKGYQWPFDPRKANGSSRVDLAIDAQRCLGRRVFMDFRVNPPGFSMDALCGEAREYLTRSGAVQDTPAARLRSMNERAYQLYLSHGIDLEKQPLEIDVCAQHNNGGLYTDCSYASDIANLYIVGEANGLFGVYRPGGSALNSTQVSSLRAAEHILRCGTDSRLSEYVPDSVLLDFCRPSGLRAEEIFARRRRSAERMSRCGAFVRNYEEICDAIASLRREIADFDLCSSDAQLFREISINYDVLITQYCYLQAIRAYIEHGGKSRGSYLINGDSRIDTAHSALVGTLALGERLSVRCEWEPVRPIPESEQWFEKVYNRK